MSNKSKTGSDVAVESSRLVMPEEALKELEDGHIFVSAAWKLIHKKAEMGDMDWMREVGKEAVKMARLQQYSPFDDDEAYHHSFA